MGFGLSYPEEIMNCVICKHGETKPALVTIMLERPPATVIFRSVPGEVCRNCGERYIDGPTTARLLHDAETAAQAGVEVEVRSYVAA